MAHKQKCSIVLSTTLLLLSLSLFSETTQAYTFIVGYGSGWTFNTQNWPNGKRFKAGDTLVFNYNPLFHNVVAVDADGYNSCSPSATSTTFTSGRDSIKLSKGPNYFICTRPIHCYAGMKIAVYAS